jgi:hypothetical protein
MADMALTEPQGLLHSDFHCRDTHPVSDNRNHLSAGLLLLWNWG